MSRSSSEVEMDCIQFAPFVWSRTRFLEYRVLVCPDIDDHNFFIDTVEHIQDSTREIDELDRERWLLIKHYGFTVWGVTCFSSFLCGERYYTTDESGRDCIGFFGYVVNSETIPILDKSAKHFEPLHEYVRSQWERKSYVKPIESEFTKIETLFLPSVSPVLGVDEQLTELNTSNERQQVISSGNIESALEAAWKVACMHPGTISLISGISKNLIPFVRFINIVVEGANETYILTGKDANQDNDRFIESDNLSIDKRGQDKKNPQSSSKEKVQSSKPSDDPLLANIPLFANIMNLFLDQKTLDIKKRTQQKMKESNERQNDDW